MKCITYYASFVIVQSTLWNLLKFNGQQGMFTSFTFAVLRLQTSIRHFLLRTSHGKFHK